jgi:GT2 family glycosyltransferase
VQGSTLASDLEDPRSPDEGVIRAVVLNFNQPALTLRCVASLAQQSYEPLEIVVVDNGSESDNLARLRDGLPPGIRLISLPINVGYAAGNNAGARPIEGMRAPTYLWVLNNDVVIDDPDTAEGLVAALRRDHRRAAVSPLIRDPRSGTRSRPPLQVRRIPDYPALLVAYSSWLAKLPSLRRIYSRQMYLERVPYPPDSEIDCESVNGSCFMIMMEFIESIGYFDEGTFLYFEELILGWQMRSRGRCGCLATSFTVDHLQGSTSKHGAAGFRTSMFLEDVRSQAYFARHYLRVSEPAVWLLYAVRATDYVARSIRHAASVRRRSGT